jgi:glyoxylate reductase
MKQKVLITPSKINIPEEISDILKPHSDVTYVKILNEKNLKDAVAVIPGVQPINSDFLDMSPNLKIVARFGVGYDAVDVMECTKRKVYVTHTPDVLSGGVADLTWALILSFMRRILEADQFTRESWANGEHSFPFGWDLEGKVLGFFGLGRIGSEVLKRAQGFDVITQYYDIIRNESMEKKYGVKFVEKENLLKTTDILTIHVPLLPTTRHILSEKEFKLMKSTAILVNTSRGAVIDEKAMVKALKQGEIMGAALDVFEKEPIPFNNPLLELDNVITTPHIASATHGTRRKMALTAINNVLAFLKNERPPNLVPEQKHVSF